jgi:cation:H+ antiporter
MALIDNLSLGGLSLVFVLAALVIAGVGTRLTGYADRLADLTGLGEAVFGAVLLGASTSLPGVVTSVTAAHDGYAALAVSNAVGGIAAQTAFLAIVDLTYRPANLEHAAASVENLLNGALLCALLALPLLAAHAPAYTWWGVHPLSLLLLLGYVYGVRLAAEAHRMPAWLPHATKETRKDIPKQVNQREPHPLRLWLSFVAAALTVALAGYVVGRTGIALVQQTGLSQSLVGGLLTAIATSLPELVTSLAAVRMGALTLAVGGIIGGNTFDVLFIAFSDIAYRKGSIYHAMDEQSLFMICMTLLLTSILLMGLIRREKRGAGNIGFEGVLVLGIYTAGFLILSFGFA